MPPVSSDRILLILDLDETLIYASEAPLERAADFRVADYHIYCRPHLDEFLAVCGRHFDLAVWSSASDSYVELVVDRIFPDRSRLKFVWGRSRATLRRSSRFDETDFFYDPWDHLNYLKPLSKVKRAGWPLERVLIVDDTPEKCLRNYGNAIYPAPFDGSEDDIELKLLAGYLEQLKDEPNVRLIEKRRWRERAAGVV